MATANWRTPLIVLICGSVAVMLSFGIRQNFGLYTAPISATLGWGREPYTFAAALQILIWGITTPFAGFIADKYGPARVLAIGSMLYATGLVLMSAMTEPIHATLSIGFVLGFAASMTGFPIVLAVIGRVAPPSRRTIYLGIASALGSSGQLFLVPIGQVFILEYGWQSSLLILAVLAALIIPLSTALAGGNTRGADATSTQPIGEAITEAFKHRGFILLTIGYFVCGAQTMFINLHLPAYLIDLGQPAWLGATAIALIGGFNIIGCILWGKLGSMYPKKYMLSILYFTRAVLMALFITLPITPVTVIIFASSMGMLWLGTVPLTSGLVAQIFGTKFMATLVGITFVSHQIGGFLGTWLGGVIFDATGNYDPIFWAGVVVGVLAALVHFPIDERPVERVAAAAASGA